MKKLLLLVLCLMLTTSVALGETLFTPGTYTAEAEGKMGTITVEVTFTEDAIESVVILNHKETPGISDPAIERIPADIIAWQSLAVDTVTGATHTSNAILEAVTDCVLQAGGDPTLLMVHPDYVIIDVPATQTDFGIF